MFDPTKPANNSPNSSAEMRSQLNGLKDLIDAILTVTAAQVDSTATLPADYPAGVSVNVIGNTLHFSFDIPRGAEGLPGPVGPPFAQAVVDVVDTLPPGSMATVNVSYDGTYVRFTFGIPQGFVGPQGLPFASAVVDAVDTLPAGSMATVDSYFDGTYVHFTFGIPQGQPGEVTAVDLSNAISGTSSNSNAVNTLDVPFVDPDAEALRQAYNALVLGLRR